jgi:hypothetical protein
MNENRTCPIKASGSPTGFTRSDCEAAADLRIDARNEKLCEKSLIAEDGYEANCFAWG